MNNCRVLVVGLTRESARGIESEIHRFEKTFKEASKLDFFVVESDSQDQTVKKLVQISERNNSFDFVSLGKLSEIYPNRIQRLQHCRNTYVQYIRSFPMDTWQLIVVADLDGVNSKLKKLNLEDFLNLDFEWAGLTANQSAPYYDILALRAKDWVEEDCFSSLERERIELEKLKLSLRSNPLAVKKLNRDLRKLREKHIYSRMLRLPKDDGYILVNSAFGGLAVYKPMVFFEADYGNPDQNLMNECEHVLFHLALVERGFKLFIKLNLINSGWNEHNLNKIQIIRLIRRLKHVIKKFGIFSIVKAEF